MADILDVNDKNFKNEVIDAQGKVLVDFWAPWCGPCRMQTPILERLSKSGKISTKITKLNTDENPETAQKFGINSIPTLILFNNGSRLNASSGFSRRTSSLKS